MSPSTLDVIIAAALDQAIEGWHNHGNVPSTLWAAGPRQTLCAVPINKEGASLSSETRIGLQALMALVCRAQYIGRIDQTLCHVYNGDNWLSRSEMEDAIDVNPAIHTAIASEGLELSSMTNVLTLARLELDADGHATWTRSTHRSDMTVDDVRVCGAMVNNPKRIEHEIRLIKIRELQDLLKGLDWALIQTKTSTPTR